MTATTPSPADRDDFPRFTDAEIQRRRETLAQLMEAESVDQLLLYGANKAGSAVEWLSEWPVTTEAALLIDTDGEDVLMVQHYNHLPNARRLARRADVRWGGVSTIETVADMLRDRGARRVGVIGPLGFESHRRLSEKVEELVGLNRQYTGLRLVKSDEEIERLRRAAQLSDAAVAAVAGGVEPGMDERALGALAESAYLAEGATNHIHYFAVTSMSDPDMCVPAQFPSTRQIDRADVLFCEISANYWGYAGQVLRTFTIDADPDPLFADLHATAEAAFQAIKAAARPGVHVQELVEASGVIEERGYTIFDDLVHGYGGGYLPPVLGTASRAHRPIPDMTLEEGMALVIQPNVITPDERAGVQTGELGVITETGWETLHTFPAGLGRVTSS